MITENNENTANTGNTEANTQNMEEQAVTVEQIGDMYNVGTIDSLMQRANEAGQNSQEG